jgi:hypothetical protein
MGSDAKKPRPAFMEDCDEEDKVVRGTKQSARTKEKSKGERQYRTAIDKKSNMNSECSSQMVTLGEKSSTRAQTVEVSKVQYIPAEKESRRKSNSGTTTRNPTKSSRPSLTRSNVTSPPKLNTELPSRPRTDPSYFGVTSPYATSTPASSSSTRSARPVSYYGGMPIPAPNSVVSRPPLARSAYFSTPTPASNMGVSYPQASPTSSFLGGMGYAVTRADSYHETDPTWVPPNPLAGRFSRLDPISRTASAQGVRALIDPFDIEAERRNIIRRRTKEAEDMPPPSIPVRRQSISQVVDSRDIYDDAIRYDSRPSRPSYREPSPAPRAPRRPSANRSSTYDYPREQPNYRIETSNHARRSSYYEGQRRSSDYEDKIRDAAGYQEQVGGPPVSLTADALRKQQRATASSRSTRSSDSHDESDFRRSATTRTTTSRFDADGENVTIKFKGDATINIAGAEIKCDDGAELNIVRSKNGSIRNGSERGSEYGMVPLDERRSRDHHRPSTYSRSTSKSNFSNPFPMRTAYQPASYF